MQAKSKSKLTFNRIQALRLKQGWTWDQTAAELGVSKVMIHLVKTGKRGLSDKVLYRLTQAEIKAGLRDSSEQPATGNIENEDMDQAGEWMVELKTRWGRRPAERDGIALAIRVLFQERAGEILDWLKRQ